MLNRLTPQTKTRLFYGLVLLIVYLIYLLAFRHTFAVIASHRQLVNDQNQDQNMGSSFVQLERKDKFYITALKSYQVKSEDRENRLWQAISGMAISNQVEISFNPNTSILTDTLALNKGVVEQQFSFRGDYFNIIKLLDTVSRAKGIGKISEVAISMKKESSGSGKLDMRLTLKGVVK